jgi:hypothetical protein
MTVGRLVLAVAILVAFPALVGAQGISNRRDVYGNLVRDNGIAAQNAPRPMTNSRVRSVQSPRYLVIRAPRRSVLVIRR